MLYNLILYSVKPISTSFIKSLGLTDNNFATCNNCSNDGCVLFCAHLLIVISDLPICYANQRLVLFCSAKATLIRFIDCHIIHNYICCKDKKITKYLLYYDKYSSFIEVCPTILQIAKIFANSFVTVGMSAMPDFLGKLTVVLFN